MPVDLDARLSQAAGQVAGAGALIAARGIARSLEAAGLRGVAPAQLSSDERVGLLEIYGDEEWVTQGLELLEAAGYGREHARLARPLRAYGRGRRQRFRPDDFVMKLPRALAERLPTSADTRRSGRNDGVDIWGEVTCSRTLRAGHLGYLGVLGGAWHARTPSGQPYVETTAAILSWLVTGRHRQGGKDAGDVHRKLIDLLELELSATVSNLEPGVDPRDYEIPCTPVERLQFRLPGTDRWLAPAAYEAAYEQLRDDPSRVDELIEAAEADDSPPAGQGTIRVYLADWFREAIAQRNPVLLNHALWAHYRPTGQRLYAFLQGRGRDDYDGSLYFFLGEPLRFTLGMRGRLDRSARAVRDALNAMRCADQRYTKPSKWSINHHHMGTKIPAFRVSASGPSRPLDASLEGKCLAARPVARRGTTAAAARRHADRVLGAHAASRATAAARGAPRQPSGTQPEHRAGP